MSEWKSLAFVNRNFDENLGNEGVYHNRKVRMIIVNTKRKPPRFLKGAIYVKCYIQ